MRSHYQYLVIGGGSGGVASARRAAKHGASTLLIESKQMGGTCVNVGCVPKKVMWYASDMAAKIRLAKDYGFEGVDASLADSFNWAGFKAKRDAYIKRLNGIYERNLTKEGVDYLFGFARFTDDGKVEVVHNQDKSKVSTFTADHILIATGGTPVFPSKIPGYELGISSDGFFELETQPKRVAVVGAGYIGVELAGVFNGLGSETHLIIRGDTVLRKFDTIIQNTVTDHYVKEGIHVHKQSQVTKIEKLEDGSKKVTLNDESSIVVDELVWTIGRKSLINLDVHKIGLKLNSKDQVIVNEYQETNVKNVYSLGDVVGKVELTPVAIATGRKLSNRLFGPEVFRTQKQDFANVPSVIFSHPEAGSIGLSEKDAIEKYGEDDIKVYQSKFTSMFYAMSEHKSPTAYKLVCVKSQNEKVVGLHIVGDASSEILQGFGVAIKMGATKANFDDCVAIHPTSAEELVTMV
ncbi:hypothetical protein KL941_000884 [Ogataea angusta]|nr:hypothetical protein KL941_000884 [Ogataea angusta]